MTRRKTVVRIRELLDKKTGELVGYSIGCPDPCVTFVHEIYTVEVKKDGERVYEPHVITWLPPCP